MVKILLPATMLLVLSAGGLADGATATFTDPTEQAFTIQVPKGWQAKGGLVRKGPIEAKPWVSVTTGDHSTILFMGDPSIPAFAERTGNGPMGRPFPLPQGSTEAPYENGQQFAADYGNKVLPHVCTNVQLKGTQPEPELAQKAEANFAQLQQQFGSNGPGPQFDGGSATFTCQANGRAFVGRISAVTSVARGPMMENWGVAGISGFTTLAGLEGRAQALVTAMTNSLQWNPQWKQREGDALRQALAQNQQNYQIGSAMIARQGEANRQTLYNQYVSSSNMLTANHNAFMQQQESQRESRNEAFAQHMYQKDVGQQNEMMYIQNQQCIHRVYNQPGNACNVYVQH